VLQCKYWQDNYNKSLPLETLKIQRYEGDQWSGIAFYIALVNLVRERPALIINISNTQVAYLEDIFSLKELADSLPEHNRSRYLNMVAEFLATDSDSSFSDSSLVDSYANAYRLRGLDLLYERSSSQEKQITNHDVETLANLGKLYETGEEDVEQDPEKALAFYRAVVEQDRKKREEENTDDSSILIHSF